MNNKYNLFFSTNGALPIVALLTVLMCSCASQPKSPASVSSDGLEPTSKKLNLQDSNSYQAALESLDRQPEYAQQVLAGLVKTYPHNAGLWTNLAMAHYRCGDSEQALKASEEATRLNADIAENYNLRGLVALEQNSYKKAERAFIAALEKDATLSLAHYNLGLLYDIYFQNIARALTHYEQYLAAHPDDKDTAAWVQQLKHSLEKR